MLGGVVPMVWLGLVGRDHITTASDSSLINDIHDEVIPMGTIQVSSHLSEGSVVRHGR